jgi:very-short-patch-repair endonuclease
MFSPLPKKLRKRRTRQLNARQFPSEVWFVKQLEKNGIKGFLRNRCLVGRFFGDFVWRQEKVVVEIDGSSHVGKEEYDRKRDAFLTENGYRVYRVKHNDAKRCQEIIEMLRVEIKPRKEKKKTIICRKPKPNKEALLQDFESKFGKYIDLFAGRAKTRFKIVDMNYGHLRLGGINYWLGTSKFYIPNPSIKGRGKALFEEYLKQSAVGKIKAITENSSSEHLSESAIARNLEMQTQHLKFIMKETDI